MASRLNRGSDFSSSMALMHTSPKPMTNPNDPLASAKHVWVTSDSGSGTTPGTATATFPAASFTANELIGHGLKIIAGTNANLGNKMRTIQVVGNSATVLTLGDDNLGEGYSAFAATSVCCVEPIVMNTGDNDSVRVFVEFRKGSTDVLYADASAKISLWIWDDHFGRYVVLDTQDCIESGKSKAFRNLRRNIDVVVTIDEMEVNSVTQDSTSAAWEDSTNCDQCRLIVKGENQK